MTITTVYTKFRTDPERDDAVAEAAASEKQELGERPGIFVVVDPPAPSCYSMQCGNLQGTRGNEPFVGAPGAIRDALRRSRDTWSDICDHMTGECGVDIYPESEDEAALGQLFNLGPVDMLRLGWCAAKHKVVESAGAEACQIDVLRRSRSDVAGSDLHAIDTEVVDNIMEWAGAKQADPCGVSPSGVTVYCVAVTRLPSMKPGTDAMTVGHFILYDVTEPGADFVVKPGQFSLPVKDPDLYQHEFGGHISQWEDSGSDFLWTYLKDPGQWECKADKLSGVPGNGCK